MADTTLDPRRHRPSQKAIDQEPFSSVVLPSRRETLASGLGLVAGLLSGSSVASRLAQGCLRTDGSDDNMYKQLGTSLQGHVLSLKVLVPGVGVGYRNSSATFLNCGYAITAAHNMWDLLQYNPTYEVGTGDNYNTNRGTVIPITQCIIHPSYDGTRNTPDIAILKFAKPYPIVPDKVIGTASAGDVLVEAGFGYEGTPSGGITSPTDGHSRAWNAKVYSLPPVQSSPVYYNSTIFASSNPQVSQEGKGWAKDSGGPVFNNTGQLVGIGIAQSGDMSPIGTTIYLMLDSIRTWLDAHTNPADINGDGSVNQADFQTFNSCATGPSIGPPATGCEQLDFDQDGDVDMDDFGYFQRHYTETQ